MKSLTTLTLAAMTAGSTLAATQVAAQDVTDLNADGFYDYAELAAVVGQEEALAMLGGDETAVLEIAADGSAVMPDSDVSTIEQEQAAGIRAEDSDDEPDYRTDESLDPTDGFTAGQDEDGE